MARRRLKHSRLHYFVIEQFDDLYYYYRNQLDSVVKDRVEPRLFSLLRQTLINQLRPNLENRLTGDLHALASAGQRSSPEQAALAGG